MNGPEKSVTRHGWADRHPGAATTAGLFSLTLMCMMFSEHPVAAAVVTAIAAVGVLAWLVDRERDRLAATAARADAANRELMRAMNAPRPIRFEPRIANHESRIATQHVMNSWPTTPMPTRPIRPRERIAR